MRNKFKLSRVAASVGVQFRFTPTTRALLLATAGLTAIGAAHANSGGFGLGSDGVTPVQTYYANTYVTNTGNLDGSGNAIRGLRKFVDTLPGLTVAGANNLGQYLPLGVADTATYAGDAYYEIAVVEYAEKMHSDLVKPTTLRGYVQIDPLATDTAGGSKSAGSNAIPLFNPATKNAAGATVAGTPIMISRPNGAGGFVSKQAYGFDIPHYLGPVIVATRGQAVRLKFYNALPLGRAVTNADGSVTRNGDLFLPVDETLIGSGYGPDGVTKYGQNRVAIHWHGGDTPWISDGTPHQWYTPAGETGYTTGVSQANVSDMPDPGPGAETLYFPNNLSGRLMFYHDHALAITRLNVYAGMAAGYVIMDGVDAALEKAPGTLTPVTNPATGATVSVPGVGLPTLADTIPLVIQDRTFVPSDIATQDSLWDQKHWGTEGDLWFPHVYEMNQDPASPDGTNPVGRWDYGPWFWPVFPAPLQLPTGAYGDVTTTPEGFMDTMVVNGTAYPKTTVEPKPYRLRILNAANDRMINLSFFVADSSVTSADGRPNTEVKMVPFVGPNGPTQVTYACPDPTDPAYADPASTTTPKAALPLPITNSNGKITKWGWTESGANTAGAILYPNSFPCAGGLQGTGWGSQDNRPGGVPDANPLLAGPNFVRIGTEGGILPNPVEIPPNVANYEYNKRSVTVLNVLERGLFIGNAERADVVVDFSAYAGKTLILYNDSPAPLPAGDPRIDYYTNDGDQSGAGGAPNTLAGFGPNTRTVMQFVVGTTANSPAPFTLGVPADPVAATPATGLYAALPKAYAAAQEAPLIPEAAYNNAFGTTNGDNFATIYSGSSIQPNFVWTPTTTTAQTLQSISVTGQGVGYTVAPNVVLTGAGLPVAGVTILPVVGVSGAQVAGGKVISVIVPANAVSGINSAPKVTFVSNAGANGVKVGGGATAQAFTNMTSSLPVKNKAIQELFDPSYGRMNATLGVELPFTSPLNQTTIPLGYIDPTTETLNDGEVQIWKITHNGVDSHPVHFHLVNLQVLNRVGWDGTIKPPYDDEQGWKETLKMNPLEDIYVAVKPRAPQLPFGIANSSRLMDPSQPAGSITGFTQVDPTTGVAPIDPVTGLTTQITNQTLDYGWEYVWHCHILGHEENDFMRPIKFNFGAVAPAAPLSLTASGYVAGTAASSVVLAWTDTTPAASSKGNKQNEIGYKILRAPAGNTTFTQVGTALANAVTYTDVTPASGATGFSATGYEYQVVSYNAAGSASTLVTAGTAAAPVAPAFPTNLAATANTSAQATVSFSDRSNNETSFIVYRATVNGATVGAYAQVGTIARAAADITATGATVTFVDPTVAGSTTYRYEVVANNNGTSSALGRSCAPARNATTCATGNTYVAVTTPVAPNLAAPSNVMVQMTGANAETLTFTDLATSETRYVVQVSTDSGKSWGDGTNTTFTQTAPAYLATANRTGGQTTGSGTAVSIAINNGANLTLTSGATPYLFRVAAATANQVGAWGNIATIDLSGQTIIAPASNVVATATVGGATLTWVDNANNNASYLLQKSVDAGATWTNVNVTLAGGATSATVTGLATVPTLFRLQAVSLGTNASSFTNSNSVTPLAPPAPVTPTGAAANRGNNGTPITATVTWTAPANATSYNLAWSTSNAALTAVTGTTTPASTGVNGGVNVISAIAGTPYTFNAPAGVANGTTVYFKLQAVGTGGNSAWTGSFNSTVR